MSCQRLPDVLPPGDTVQAIHHVHLEPLPRHVAQARRFVREHAPPLPEDTIDALLLLTSELVTNAVLHARTPIELGITVAEHSLLVTVHDEDLSRHEQRPYDGREGGWGLGLVTALATRSDLTVFPGEGKTAWFILPRSGPVTAAPDAAARDDDLRGTL
jgi:anti-sigma regulatory factor (Ser/Thr protein kinase)